jgi:hypothetical protein
MKRTVSRDIFLQCHFLTDEFIQKVKDRDSQSPLKKDCSNRHPQAGENDAPS